MDLSLQNLIGQYVIFVKFCRRNNEPSQNLTLQGNIKGLNKSEILLCKILKTKEINQGFCSAVPRAANHICQSSLSRNKKK